MQLFLCFATILLSSKVPVVFKSSFSYVNFNLSNRRVLRAQFSTSKKYLYILHALLHSKSHLLGFHI